MSTSVLIAVVAGGLVALAVAVGFVRNRLSPPLRQSLDTPPAEPPGLDPATADDARRLAAGGRTVEAIKLVRERTGLGLREAKDAVEALGPGAPPPGSGPGRRPEPAAAGPAFEAEVRALVATGAKIEAIKLVRQRTGLDLRQAKELVERLQG